MNQRGRTPPRDSGKRPPSPPPPMAMRNKGAAGCESRRGARVLHTCGLAGGAPRELAWTAGPAPTPPRLGQEPRNGHPPPPAARAHGPGLRPDTRRARGRSPASRGFEDPGQRLRVWQERRRGSTLPARRGSRCGRRAYPAVPPLGLLGALRSSSRGRRPSGLGCLRPGWRADPRTRHRCPPRQIRAPAPRPAPPRACALADSGLRTGRGGAGREAG